MFIFTQGAGRSAFPASHTLFARFPSPSLVFFASICVLFLLQNIAQCCEIYFLFLLAPAP